MFSIEKCGWESVGSCVWLDDGCGVGFSDLDCFVILRCESLYSVEMSMRGGLWENGMDVSTSPGLGKDIA